MYYKEDWPQAQQRLDALWRGELIDRSCIAVTAPRKGCEGFFQGVSPHGFYNNGGMLASHHMDDPPTILKKAEEIFANTFYGGEAFPQVWLNYGPAGHAAYFDAPYEVTPATTWFGPVIEDWEETPPQFNPDNQILKWQLDAAAYLAKAGEGRFLVSTPDNSGSLDALASLRGTQNLLMDMIAEPEQVLAANQQVMAAWNTAGEQLFHQTKSCNQGGSTIGWLPIWAKGRMSQLQVDISVMLSQEMFQKYAMPELLWCSQQQEHSLYHMDGQDQIRHLEQILSVPGIGMIQWVSVAGEPSYRNFIPVFQRIQAAGKSLLINDVLPQDIPFLLEHLAPHRLLLMTSTPTQSEAESLLAYAAG